MMESTMPIRMMRTPTLRTIGLASALLVLGGCVTMPTGPSVLVLPGAGKSFEDFQLDNQVCMGWASQMAGQTPQQVGENRAATGAVIGTLVGAASGAAIGAAAGNPAAGAAIGGGSGLVLGTAGGASAGSAWAYETQRRYDIAFQQCMYAKGNQIPVDAPANGYNYSSDSSRIAPPPPPGPPPPPPPHR